MPRTKGALADRWWADAIRKVAAKPDRSDPEKRKNIEMIAHKLFDRAAEGDVQAMKEIGDRLDGRPHQSTTTEISGQIDHKHEQVVHESHAFESRIAGLSARGEAAPGTGKLN